MTDEKLDATFNRFLQRKKKQLAQAEAKETLEESRIDFSDFVGLIGSLTAIANLDNDAPCASCSYFAETPEMVCALHPEGPEGNSCPDFEDLNKGNS